MDNSTKQLVALEEQLNSQIPDPKELSAKSAKLISAEEQWSEAIWRIANSSRPAKLNNNEIQEGLNLIEKPVFICGVPRSGTTLLSNLLDEHSQLLILPPEGLYLTHIRANLMRLEPGKRLERFCRIWAARFVASFMVPPHWYLGKSDGQKQPYVDFVRKLIMWIRTLEPLFPSSLDFAWHAAVPLAYNSVRENSMPLASFSYWVDKTPENEFHLQQFWNFFPHTRVLHVVRNPLSVFSSRMHIERLTRSCEPDQIISRSILIKLACSHKMASQLCHTISPDKYKVVRYEDLVDDRKGTMNGVADVLNIKPADSLYRQTVAGKETQPNTSFVKGPPSVVECSSQEKRLVAAFTVRYASKLGYTLPQSGIRERLTVKGRLWFGALSIRVKYYILRKLS